MFTSSGFRARVQREARFDWGVAMLPYYQGTPHAPADLVHFPCIAVDAPLASTSWRFRHPRSAAAIEKLAGKLARPCALKSLTASTTRANC